MLKHPRSWYKCEADARLPSPGYKPPNTEKNGTKSTEHKKGLQQQSNIFTTAALFFVHFSPGILKDKTMNNKLLFNKFMKN